MIWNNTINGRFELIRKCKPHSNRIQIKSNILWRIFMTRRWSLTELSWHTRHSIFSSNINWNWSRWLILNVLISILLRRLSINWSAFKNIHLIISLVWKLIICSSISLMEEIYHSMSPPRTWICLSCHLHSYAMVF